MALTSMHSHTNFIASCECSSFSDKPTDKPVERVTIHGREAQVMSGKRQLGPVEELLTNETNRFLATDHSSARGHTMHRGNHNEGCNLNLASLLICPMLREMAVGPQMFAMEKRLAPCHMVSVLEIVR